MKDPGGCLTYAIPAYRLPKHYVQKLVAAFKKMGVKFQMETTLGQDITTAELEAGYDKVFFATGAWQRPVLGFDGEEFTEFGLQFLKQVNLWVNKKQRNNVLVVGGGNVAMEMKPNDKCNFGIGIPTLVPNILYEQGVNDKIVMISESGLIGGVPAEGGDFGAHWNPEVMV